MTLVIGIDGGGTSCRAALATAGGEIIGRGKSGAANIRTDLTGARASIVEAARLAFTDAGRDPDLIAQTPALLGLAGSNVGTYRQQLEAILPFSRNVVTSDALIALEGAVGTGDGAIAVLGTGTVYMVRHGGKVRSVGGWGFLVGDQGSGARIGRDLLEETLLAYDGIAEASDLTRALLAVFRNEPRDVVEFTTTAKPGDLGGFAPMVFDHAAKGDAVAEKILGRAIHFIEESLRVMKLRPGDPLCLLGGLAPLYEPRLRADVRSLIKPPLQDALGGAISMALRLFAEGDQGKAGSHG
ncbi:N-acetylglucosamine kinase [Mesorhizobium sp. BAC0120]|uniref:N-acetylglucosamine kinase n=1 Tax=Mesorhizobium sp. BAC0120 TaxID=3090670 RepID=UPI00298BDC43|nr:N-acetylglucosamine kinase [Mesorhizobium sp. BAC0120]MDW6026646.1 N-acetylglucosamine kinase [Mesorhizobium sp. BAC0120]